MLFGRCGPSTQEAKTFPAVVPIVLVVSWPPSRPSVLSGLSLLGSWPPGLLVVPCRLQNKEQAVLQEASHPAAPPQPVPSITGAHGVPAPDSPHPGCSGLRT